MDCISSLWIINALLERCNAKCAGLTEEEIHECSGLVNVVPGKTKLPPGRVPQSSIKEQQLVGEDEQQEEDI